MKKTKATFILLAIVLIVAIAALMYLKGDKITTSTLVELELVHGAQSGEWGVLYEDGVLKLKAGAEQEEPFNKEVQWSVDEGELVITGGAISEGRHKLVPVLYKSDTYYLSEDTYNREGLGPIIGPNAIDEGRHILDSNIRPPKKEL